MEDQHTCATEIPGLPGHAFFAVYDGHGGKEAAIISNRTVLPCIQKQKQYTDYCAVSECPPPPPPPPPLRGPRPAGPALGRCCRC
eukprot:COSAG02_NODE_2968_length_7640_cov_10.957831_5_plen_84_part_01